eukprot:3963759-Pleurochrysis_carterae.AAC.1
MHKRRARGLEQHRAQLRVQRMPVSQQRRTALERARAYGEGTRRSRRLRHLPLERAAHPQRPAVRDQLPRSLFQPQHGVPSGAQI